MDDEYPRYLYKYRGVDTKNLEKDYSLQALFACEAIFSGRKNFNDLFDSKIDIVSPTPKQIKVLMNKSDKRIKDFLQSFIAKGKFTAEGRERLQEAMEQFNRLIDSYRFLCLSKNPKSNLMWSHYADSHKGFCIEFKSDHLSAEKVTYKEQIPEIELIQIFGVFRPENSLLGEHIWKSLMVKLKEWEYEEEYRYHAGNQMMQSITPINAASGKVKYSSDFVESVIFGCKMAESTKEFIREKLPFKTKFKQAIALKSCIDIIEPVLNSV